MAFPTVATSSSGTQANAVSTTLTATLPASIASGDLLIVFAAQDKNNTITAATGWTLLDTSSVASPGSGTGAFAYKVATGSEGATEAVLESSSVEEWAYGVYRITGANVVGGIDYTGTTGATGAPDPPSHTTSFGAGDNLWIAFGVQDNAEMDGNGATNYTTNLLTEADTDAQITVGTREYSASATDDPGVLSATGNDEWAAWTITVEPTGSGTNVLTATDVSSTSSVDSSSIGQVHTITSSDVQSTSSVDSPTLGQEVVLSGADIESATETSQPDIGQEHTLTSISVESVSSLSIVSAAGDLVAVGLESLSGVVSPTFEQVHVLLSVGLDAESNLSVPISAQSHAMMASGVEAFPEFSASFCYSPVKSPERTARVPQESRVAPIPKVLTYRIG